MERFQTLRDSAYGVTYATEYLQQGRYAEATVSTGAEAELGRRPPRRGSQFKRRHAGGRSAGTGARGLTLFDADGDGDLDLSVAGASGMRLFRHRRGGGSPTSTAADGRSTPASRRAPSAPCAGDYDNDGQPDVFVLGERRQPALHQEAGRQVRGRHGGGRHLPAATRARAVRGVRRRRSRRRPRHLSSAAAARPTSCCATTATARSPTSPPPPASRGGAGTRIAIVPDRLRQPARHRPADRRARTAPPALFQQHARRHVPGRGRERAGCPAAGGYTARRRRRRQQGRLSPISSSAAPDGPACFALSDGRGRLRRAGRPGGLGRRGRRAVRRLRQRRPARSAGRRSRAARICSATSASRWIDVTRGPAPRRRCRRRPSALRSRWPSAISTATATPTSSSGPAPARCACGATTAAAGSASLRVPLAARVSNRGGVGAKIEMRAGSLRQSSRPRRRRRPWRPPTCVFGLGARTGGRRRPRPVAVGHPAGRDRAGGAGAGGAAASPSPSSIASPRRARSSSPGTARRFEFVTDFMGGGEMGYWVGAGRVEHAGPRRVRAHPRRPAAAARRPLRAPRHQRARGGDVPRSRCSSSRSIIPRTSRSIPNEGLRDRRGRRSGCSAARGARPPLARASTITATTCCRRSRRSIAAIPTTSDAADPRLRRAAHADARSRPGCRSRACCCSPAGPTTRSRATTSPRSRRPDDAAAVAAGQGRRPAPGGP